MTTCGLWITTKQLTAVVVDDDDDDGRVAARYAACRDSNHIWDLLTRIAGEQGLDCTLVIPHAFMRERFVSPWLFRSGFTDVWVVPEPVVAPWHASLARPTYPEA